MTDVKKIAEWAGFVESIAGKKMSPYAEFGDKSGVLPRVPKYCEWKYPDFPHDLNACMEWLEPVLYKKGYRVMLTRLQDGFSVTILKASEHGWAKRVVDAFENTFALAFFKAVDNLIDWEAKQNAE